MDGQYTISQLAKLASIPTTTLRYYDQIGLLEPEGRSHGNYRLYGEESLRKVKFIRAAQSIGFTLDDVKSLLLDDGTPNCGSVQESIRVRLTDIEERLKDLRHIRRVLKLTLEKCQKQNKTDRCHVIESSHCRS